MSQDDKPSEKFPALKPVETPAEGDQDDAMATPPPSKHKVIADIHSGMVLVAPVATPLEEVDLDEEEPEAADSKKPLN